jgi:hypothetical protein
VVRIRETVLHFLRNVVYHIQSCGIQKIRNYLWKTSSEALYPQAPMMTILSDLTFILYMSKYTEKGLLGTDSMSKQNLVKITNSYWGCKVTRCFISFIIRVNLDIWMNEFRGETLKQFPVLSVFQLDLSFPRAECWTLLVGDLTSDSLTFWCVTMSTSPLLSRVQCVEHCEAEI